METTLPTLNQQVSALLEQLVTKQVKLENIITGSKDDAVASLANNLQAKLLRELIMSCLTNDIEDLFNGVNTRCAKGTSGAKNGH